MDVPAAGAPARTVWLAPRPVPFGVTVAATLLTGAVLLVAGSLGSALAAGLVLAVLALLARRARSAAAMDAVVVTLLLHAAVAVGVFGLWPLPGAVAVAVAWVVAKRSSRAALWRSWLRAGRVTAELPWLMVGTVLVTAAALVVWQRLSGGRLPQAYVDVAAGQPLWLLVLAGAGFSLLNAAVEEAIFRGVLQGALHRVSGPVLAVVVQALAFGVLHVVGIPTGVVGAVMAGAWGVLLGVMRWRTGGIVAPYVAHVAADATIFCMLLPTLR